MVTITSLTQQDIRNCNIQNCFIHSNGLTVSTKILNYIFGVMVLQMKQKTEFWKIGPCTFNPPEHSCLSYNTESDWLITWCILCEWFPSWYRYQCIFYQTLYSNSCVNATPQNTKEMSLRTYTMTARYINVTANLRLYTLLVIWVNFETALLHQSVSRNAIILVVLLMG